MNNLFWLTDAQMVRLEPVFPKRYGKPRVDDRRVLSGIIFINRNGLRWCDAPIEYGPPKTLYNQWKRWGEKGIFAWMVEGLAAEAAVPKIGCVERQGDKALHLGPEVTRQAHQARQAPLQAAQPDRDHVRAFEGLATRCHTVRPVPKGLPLRRRPRCNRHVLVMTRERVPTLVPGLAQPHA